jgi:hypothetical protein
MLGLYQNKVGMMSASSMTLAEKISMQAVAQGAQQQ